MPGNPSTDDIDLPPATGGPADDWVDISGGRQPGDRVVVVNTGNTGLRLASTLDGAPPTQLAHGWPLAPGERLTLSLANGLFVRNCSSGRVGSVNVTDEG